MSEEKRRQKAEEAERQREHLKVMRDYANSLPRPDAAGIVHVPRRDVWGKR